MRRLLALAALLGAAAPSAFAADANDVIRFAQHIQAMRITGDLRMRQESIQRLGTGAPPGAAVDPRSNYTDRSRTRYRLRIGTEFELPEELVVALRLGAGTGEQNSNNQSLDNLGTQKALFVDQAYLRWNPRVGDDTTLRFSAGKMTNWLWRVYSSDLIFDDDFNPEGFQQSVEWLAPMGVSVFAGALQMVADEDATRYRNQWMFSQQAGFETRLPFETRLRTALAYHKWSDEQHSDFAQIGVGDGNRRRAGAPGALVNKFGVGEWTSELSAWAWGVPVRGQLTLARNFRARGDLPGPAARDGYQYGVILGRAKLRGQTEFGAFKKYSQTDVTVADVADSDWGDGGTNRQGGIVWLTYAIRDYITARAKYFSTKVIDSNFPVVTAASHPHLGAYNAGPGDKPVNRFQLDLQLAF